jgi:predicted RNA-binding protein with PIN domain
LKILFVDGYNVINSWPNLKMNKDEDFDGVRKSLTDSMHTYAVYNNYKVIIVFDAYKVNGSIEKTEVVNKNLEIVFTKEGETADSYIERKVHEIGKRYEVCVVTSDGLEQQTIFHGGASRVSSIEFYNEIKAMEKTIKAENKPNKIQNKNHLQDNINNDVLKKLEEIRRSK